VSAKLEFSRGETIAEKYEVVDVLDESPLGVTYRTKHLKTGKYVRLQLLRPRIAGREQKDQIVDLFKKSKAVDSPHLVKYGELGEHQGVAYITYEDFEGGTLRDLLQEYRVAGKQFGLKEAAQICIGILDGLSDLHKAGVIVRALRPEYVLINVRYAGPAKKTFVAQTKITGGAFWNLVPTAVIAEDEFTRGEAQYLAPELKSFEPVPSPRSDVYSVAVMFYELLVGVPPVGTYQEPRSRRPELPDHVNTVTELGLSNSPDDRYPSTGDFVADLRRTFQDVAVEENEGGGRRALLVSLLAMGLAFLFVMFIAIILFFSQSDPALEAEAADSQVRKEVLDTLTAAQPSESKYREMYQRHPSNMVWVPAGPFVRGRMRQDPSANTKEPLAEVSETPGFLIDVFEYPNLKGQAPRFDVTFDQATQLCAEAGKHLCSADEWERACKGPQSKIYSYGNTYDTEYCGGGIEEIYSSGAKGECRSDYGAFDQSGSFREWTSSPAKKGRYFVKGGEKGTPERGTRCASATDESENYADKTLSFRCCRNENDPPFVPPPPPPPPEPAPVTP
jgi:serine/threonine protein kinase